jgi:hypothetical protein
MYSYEKDRDHCRYNKRNPKKGIERRHIRSSASILHTTTDAVTTKEIPKRELRVTSVW